MFKNDEFPRFTVENYILVKKNNEKDLIYYGKGLESIKELIRIAGGDDYRIYGSTAVNGTSSVISQLDEKKIIACQENGVFTSSPEFKIATSGFYCEVEPDCDTALVLKYPDESGIDYGYLNPEAFVEHREDFEEICGNELPKNINDIFGDYGYNVPEEIRDIIYSLMPEATRVDVSSSDCECEPKRFKRPRWSRNPSMARLVRAAADRNPPVLGGGGCQLESWIDKQQSKERM